MIFVDSSVWIAYFNDDPDPLANRLDDALRTGEPICIADMILTEVLQGFRRDRDFEFARKTLAEVERLTLSYGTYVNAARLFRRLRTRGVTPKTVDCILAQACIETGATLLTMDGDFDPIAEHSRLRVLRL